MVKLQKDGAMTIGVILAVLAVACEAFSMAAFYGFGAESWPICGSACEVWPGIRAGEVCILICVLRNGAYIPAFYAGLATGCAAAGVFVAGFKTRQGKKVEDVPAAR
ncbi:MAG: hypothetical protein GYA24_16465 [Candidatus Lokiarchaeota archaeon]|nr:hypothetical protein [Candidatus Lokiarchaeota archaeon]